MDKNFRENQLYRELLSVSGLNPWDGHDSSSRKQMFAGHLAQALVIEGANPRRHQTGMEREYGKYTFDVKMPVNAEVVKIIDRYRKTFEQNAIEHNPQTIVLYEDVNTKEIGMISLEGHCSHHSYFGFKYKKRAGLNKIQTGEFIPAGTILQSTTNLDDNGNYSYGRRCNMLYASVPAVSEDSIWASRQVLEHFAFRTYERRVVEFGSKFFPLNIYGNDEIYKIMPDIGDIIREDGALMALRAYDKELGAIQQSKRALRKIDPVFDKIIYGAGPGGKIVDIIVHHELNNSQPGTPEGMDTQPMKYDQSRRRFYQEILNEYYRLKKMRGAALQLSPELHRLVVEAMAVMSNNENQKISKLYRKVPLDDWRIEFVIEYRIVPTIGFKLTDCHGGKGIICKISDESEMPVDEFGNRADLVMDPASTISRMNLGRMYEQTYGSSNVNVSRSFRNRIGLKEGQRINEMILEDMDQHGGVPSAIWEDLMKYYHIFSPARMYRRFTEMLQPGEKYKHLASVLNDGIFLYLPPENEPESVDIATQLNEFFPLNYGPITYTGNSGRRVTTKEPMLIGEMYIMLLEKIGDDWTAVSSGRFQHFGVLGQTTNADKYNQPTRQQAIRANGEAEIRISASYGGGEYAAEIMDRNNSIPTHEEMVRVILQADKPTNIKNAVDRTKVPFGNSKPLQLVNHLGECAGWKFKAEIYKPTWAAPKK